MIRRINFYTITHQWACLHMGTPAEAYYPDCPLPIVKHGGGSVMVREGISWHSRGPIVTLKGKVKVNFYEGILSDQIHSLAQALLLAGEAIFQDDNASIHTARTVQ